MTNEEIKQATPKEKFNDFHKQVAYELGFEQGAQWADRTMVEKACEWLKNNAGSYVWRSGIKIVNCGICDEFFNDFKKAMEGKK